MTRRAALHCRQIIAFNARNIEQVGFQQIDLCHRRRDQHRTTRDCNFLFDVTLFSEAVARGLGRVGAECAADNPINDNFPDGDPKAAMNFMELPVEDSGTEIQGSPTLTGDPQTVARLEQCHEAIGKTRTAIVNSIVKREMACQKAADRAGGALEALSASCVFGPDRTTEHVRQTLATACQGVAGAQVGSCDGLPDCVVAAATRTAETIVRNTYGGSPAQRQSLCGNGIRDVGEACDDGAANGPGPCNGVCHKASCGDGFVEAGVEECDEGSNNKNTGECLLTCKKARCGDGFVWKGVEDCDPAAPDTPPGTCADDCKNGLTCPAGGTFTGNLNLTFSASLYSNVAGITVALVYPGSLAIPAPTSKYVHDVTATKSGINTATNAAATRTLTVVHSNSSADTVPGAFRTIDFTCNPGDVITAASFGCTVVSASDSSGSDPGIPPDSCKLLLPVADTTSTTTTTTTSTLQTSAVLADGLVFARTGGEELPRGLPE
jgi:hypothetical protein